MKDYISVVAKKEIDFNDFFAHRTHFFKAKHINDSSVLILDFFGRGDEFEVPKSFFDEHFIQVSDKEFEEYDAISQEGFSQKIDDFTSSIAKKYNF